MARLEAARAEGLDVAADQYPYTAASTTLATILPPALQALGVDQCVAALTDPHIRDLVRNEIGRGISGWENVAADPGWDGIRIAYAASHPDWAGRSLSELADEAHADPSDLAFDALVADRLDVSVVIDCMSEPDVDDDHGRALDRGLHRRRGPPSGSSDPRRRAASPARLREHGAGARAVRSRAGGPVARDGGREAHLGPGRPDRPARPRGRPGRRRRGPGRVRSGDRRRRGDVHRPGPLPDRHPARHRQRTSRDPRWRRDRRAGGSVAPALVTDRRARRPRAADDRHGRHRDTGRRAAAGRTAGVHAAPLPAVARPARGDPSGAWRGRDRAGGRSARLARPRAAHRHLPAANANRGCAATSRARRATGPRSPPAADCVTGRRSASAASSIDFASCRRGPACVARPSSGSAAPRRTRSSSTSPRRTGDRSARSSRHGSSRGRAPRSNARSAATPRRSASARPRSAIRDQRTRWGSASRQSRLAFSWRLILAPPEALETVVIHELAHLRVFGHGPRFWAVVASRRPDHKVWRRWLHDHSAELHAALDERAERP